MSIEVTEAHYPDEDGRHDYVYHTLHLDGGDLRLVFYDSDHGKEWFIDISGNVENEYIDLTPADFPKLLEFFTKTLIPK